MIFKSRKKKILIIDDSELDREKIKRCLSRNRDTEFEIFELDGIATANEFTNKHDVDCIILDYRLPDGEPIGFIIENTEIPIIIITEYGNERIVTDLLKKGASDYISKSDVNISSINRIVRSAIEKNEWKKKSELHQEELKNFVSQIAHDLQNPLNGIMGFSELLSDSDNLNTEEHDRLEKIKESANGMSTLINSLLKYSTLDLNKDDFKLVSLNNIFNEIKQEFLENFNKIGGEILISDCPNVIGVSFRLKQLFKNIIENSIKYRKKENPLKVAISVSHQNGEFVEISISDNGIGFAQKDATKIFSPFSRLENNDINGHGIGLATCRRIVSQHGGSIRAVSEEGAGTNLFITFPLAIENPQ